MPPTNLPARLSSFVGREQVLAGLHRLLVGDSPAPRLVTLTGTGGTGKTRVALQVAHDLRASFAGGVFFVALAPISDPDLVVPTVARALGLPDSGERPPLERLIDHLRGRRVLLVLDNFEQILDAAPTVSRVLADCPDLRVLVTSRAALRLSGEQEYLIPPLTLPASSSHPSDELADQVGRNEAVRLFVERACAVRAGFALTDQNAPAVVELCRRLDGLPLAIELAAVHARLMDPPAILARFESASGRLQLLGGGAQDVPPRQRTLRATIRWSHDLLEPREQVLFRRLAVFVGGCTLAAAEAICAGVGAANQTDGAAEGAPAVLPLMESLLAKSLLQARPVEGCETRVVMLETIREFALERLAEAGETEVLRRRHAEHFLELAERAEAGIRGPDELAWIERLQDDLDNIRAALAWGLERDGELALRLGSALDWFWWMRGQSEGQGWLMRALEGSDGDPRWRVKTLLSAGHLAHYQHDAAARQLLEEGLATARDRGDRWAEAWALHVLGRVAYYENDAAAARSLGERSLAAARAAGDEWLVGWAVHLLGLAAHVAGDYRTARSHYERSLAIRARLGQTSTIAPLWTLLGMVAFREGDLAAARTWYADSLRLVRDLRFYFNLSVVLANVSGLAASVGQLETAVRLAAASTRLGETHHVRRIPLTDEIAVEGLARARRELDRVTYEAVWAQGRATPMDEAVAEALGVLAALDLPSGVSGARTDGRRGSSPAGLTAAETRVLRLLAKGLTTQQIATELVVARSTVERHITHVYAKIDVRGRAAATAFALQHGLLDDDRGTAGT